MSATAILKLEQAGFSREQVEALAEYLDGQLATKADLNELRADVKSDLKEIRAEMRELELRLRLWMVAQVFVIVGVLGTVGYFG